MAGRDASATPPFTPGEESLDDIRERLRRRDAKSPPPPALTPDGTLGVRAAAVVREVTLRWVTVARPVAGSFGAALRSTGPRLLKAGSAIAAATKVSLAWSLHLVKRVLVLALGWARSSMVRGARPIARPRLPAPVRVEMPDTARQVDIEPHPNSDAMRLAQHRLAAAERAFGYEHPSVAAELHLIGALHHEVANFNEALAAYGAALGIQERTLGRAHPAAAATARDLAAARQDEFDAREMAERVQENSSPFASVAR